LAGEETRLPALRSFMALGYFAVLALALALGGCTSIPAGRSSVDAVNIAGTAALDDSTVADKLATAPTEKFFGLFRGILYDYEVYDPTVVQRDLARIERYYRGKGFLEVHARAGRVSQISANHVRVDIVVEEGPPTLNRGVQIEGLGTLPSAIANDVFAAAQGALPVGARFDEDGYQAAKTAVLKALTDRGYAYAASTASASIDLGSHQANYVFTVVPGPVAKFGAITFVGLDPTGPRPQEIGEAPLLRAMNIDPGDPYSTEAIDEATRALLDLEVFSAVTIEPQLTQPPPANPVVALVVKAEPTRLREVRLGFGAEFDEIKTDLHLISAWENHNFLGGLRDLTITFQPGTVLYPTRLGNYVLPNKPLLEERFQIELKQPSFFEAHTNGFITPQFNVFPFLVVPNPPPNSPVIGYIEGRGAIGVERPFFGHKLDVILSYNAQVEDPFSYVSIPHETGTPTINLSPVVVLYPDLVTRLDLRDDPNEPHQGIYLANDLQVAGVGGEVSDVRALPEVRTYIPLGKRVTFATRASMGFLFAANYAQGTGGPDGFKGELLKYTNNPASLSQGALDTYVSDIEKIYFRGFFSGGPSSNRGFPLRGVAPYADVPFLTPGTAASIVARSCEPVAGVVPPGCTSPTGGFTLWEFSNELRVKVSGPLLTAVFCDMSDVSANRFDVRLNHPHLSCGFGVRYATPVGPIRLDIGYRIEGLQVLGKKNDVAASQADPTEGIVPRLFGLPLAVAFGIGEAY
jgi:outer membrane protein assembly factor BamA